MEMQGIKMNVIETKILIDKLSQISGELYHSVGAVDASEAINKVIDTLVYYVELASKEKKLEKYNIILDIYGIIYYISIRN